MATSTFEPDQHPVDDMTKSELPTTIGVVGGGTMGVGIAYVFARAGWSTTVVEPDDDRAAAMRITMVEAVRQGVARGKLSADQADAIPDAVRRVRSVGELDSDLGLVVETVPERFEVKRVVLVEIEQRRPRVIATNSSALSINELAAVMARPASFLGMHFFNPVWSLPMVEIVRGTATTDETVDRACRIALAIGKQTITVNDSPGFATSRLDLIASLEAMRMLEDGVASAVDIDRAMVIAYRHPVGPLRLSDMVGLDVRLDIARNLAASLGDRYAPPRILVDKVAAGELGQKSGRGFFTWSDGVGPAAADTSSPSSPIARPKGSQ